MSTSRYIDRVLWLAALLVAGCSSSSASGTSLSLTAIHGWDGGADAGCTISGSGTKVGCDTVYPIAGNPYACAGFDGGAGTTTRCEVVCSSGLVCALTGLSDGTNGVDCSASCASPEH